MINNCFTFLEGIGKLQETRLKNQGIRTWKDFLKQKRILGISPKRKLYYDFILDRCQKKLREQDFKFFSKILPKTEHYRFYQQYKSKCLFLDIEVDSNHEIILIGLFDGFDTRHLIKGINLDKDLFQSILNEYDFIVTFNGNTFDIPKIEKHFNIKLNTCVIDLKHLCHKKNLFGGLKDIEKQLDIKRPAHLNGSPVSLWKAFHASGDREYLDLLLQYNEEDVINLKFLLEHLSNS